MAGMTRRLFVKEAAAVLAALLAGAQPASAGQADPKLVEDLVAGNRILVDQGVLAEASLASALGACP